VTYCKSKLLTLSGRCSWVATMYTMCGDLVANNRKAHVEKGQCSLFLVIQKSLLSNQSITLYSLEDEYRHGQSKSTQIGRLE
jgi:hypothetical protein